MKLSLKSPSIIIQQQCVPFWLDPRRYGEWWFNPLTAILEMRLKMTIGICPPPSGPTPVAREMRRVSDSIKTGYLRMRNCSPPSLRSCKARYWVPGMQIPQTAMVKSSLNSSPTTFFARFVSCKSPLSNFYKHDFCFRGKCFDGIHRAYQYHQAILLKKHKVAKSIMNAPQHTTLQNKDFP